MNKLIFLLIATSVLLSSAAQIALKTGMSSTQVISAINSDNKFIAVQAIICNLHVLGGLFLYFTSAAVWLLVLAKIDVSTAYPFVGLGFIITMLLAYLINGEPITIAKICGTLFITIGVSLIARG